jgi:hypothetical protein
MATPETGEKLHTELKLVDAAAFSVGLIGPVGAIGLLGTGAALIIGRAGVRAGLAAGRAP